MSFTTAQSPESLDSKEKFFRYFQHEITALQQQMDRLADKALAGGERVDATDHCLASIARLSAEVKDASVYIPAYDQRTYSEAIKALSLRLQENRATFAPKARFSFKTSFAQKKNASAISISDAAHLAAQQRAHVPTSYYGSGSEGPSSVGSPLSPTPQQLRSPSVDTDEDRRVELNLTLAPALGSDDGRSRTLALGGDGSRNKEPFHANQAAILKSSFSQSSNVNISDHTSVNIVLPPSAAHAASSGVLSNLHRCVIDMSGPTSTGKSFAGLTLKNIKESLIICGRVDGPAHVTGVENGIVVAACRQFRMHECRNCDVYLHCASRPIIEDCSGIKFAPLPHAYIMESNRDIENRWDQVDDFKWLKSEPSPNWKTLPEQDRIKESIWTDLVPGGPEHGLEDILQGVGIQKPDPCSTPAGLSW